MQQICFIKGLQRQIGGEEHAGWLPEGAAMPLPTPTRDVILDVSIEFDGYGYLLIYHSTDHSICGDLYYSSVTEVQNAAFELFGIEPSQWIIA